MLVLISDIFPCFLNHFNFFPQNSGGGGRWCTFCTLKPSEFREHYSAFARTRMHARARTVKQFMKPNFTYINAISFYIV
jgi:hypothetical protein